jgi:hypothetical protein
MKDYLRLWAEGFLELSPGYIKHRVSVVGERNQVLGPRIEAAKFNVTVEPSETFEVVNLVPETEVLKGAGFPDWAIFGILDVLLVADFGPLREVRIILEEVGYDEISSSPMAFRQAGRDAGRKIMKIRHDDLIYKKTSDSRN